MLIGTTALAGAIKRLEERPSNDLPVEVHQVDQESATGWEDDIDGDWVHSGWTDRC